MRDGLLLKLRPVGSFSKYQSIINDTKFIAGNDEQQQKKNRRIKQETLFSRKTLPLGWVWSVNDTFLKSVVYKSLLYTLFFKSLYS